MSPDARPLESPTRSSHRHAGSRSPIAREPRHNDRAARRPPSPQRSHRTMSSSPEPSRKRRRYSRSRERSPVRRARDASPRRDRSRDRRIRDPGHSFHKDRETDRVSHRRRDSRSPSPPRERRRPHGRSRSRERRPRHRSRSSSYDRRPRRHEDIDKPRKREDTYKGKDRDQHASRQGRDDSRHRTQTTKAARPSPPRSPVRRSAPLPSQSAAFTTELDPDAPPPVEKQKPNFAPTGLLAKEANKVANTSISLKYHEPPEARKPPPSAAWSLLTFKGDDCLATTELHTRSCWLVGREAKVADILVEHGSCSGQHAVLQFRWREGKGGAKGKVKPYVIDLESRNGTLLNGEKIEPGRYVEVRSGDVLGFGESSREYVLMLPPKE